MKKPDLKNFWKTRKKLLIILAVVIAVAAVGGGVWYHFGHNSSEPVYVYPFDYIGMTEYWGDSQESYGPVTTDKIQTIFLTDTQTVTEILVAQGDTVKKGDLLMTFDTTLSDLALERKRLDVEKLKLQVEDARDELRRINGMRPMSIPTITDEEADENLGSKLSDAYAISTQWGYDGSTAENAIILWMAGETFLNDAILEDVRATAETYWNKNLELDYSASLEGAEPEPPADAGDAEVPAEQAEEIPSDPAEPLPPYQYQTMEHFFVVVKVTSGDMSLGSKQVWQGLEVSGTLESGFTFRLFNANALEDHMSLDDGGDGSNGVSIDYGSGYTAAQIAQMRSDQEKKIKDLEFSVKMADAEYKIMQLEMGDGNVYAQIDGTVVSLLPEEEAKTMQQPLMKVSGGGGFYVEGFVSELEKDKMVIGQEVTVNDWNTGMTYTGSVVSLGDFPTSEGYWNGMGNPNASYYPFNVFIDETADLQSGSYVSVMYSAGESQNGIYLQNPFVRTEKGQSYVLVLGKNGRLEQRFVTTGKSLWGSYTEILDGLTAEDLVAFPYGKNVKPGVAAQEGDMSNLYG